jgi:hypothetical protein
MGTQRQQAAPAAVATCLFLSLLVVAVPAWSDEPAVAARPHGYVCNHLDGPIAIDGALDDPGWHDVPWTGAFVDIEGDARPRPRFRTRAKMAWDNGFFYVAAELEEHDVWATLTKHDAVIFHDNDFEVFIDPDGDNHEYYEFEINALNTGWDLLLRKPYRDGGPAENAWEIPGLRTAVAVAGTLNHPGDRDRGWTVEIAFPWRALAGLAHRPSPPREDDTWRVNFSRVEWEVDVVDQAYRKRPGRKEDNWVWSPQGAIDMHRPEQWGFVQFTTRPPSNDVAFRPESSWPARAALMRVYHAQVAFRKAHGRWAGGLAELGTQAGSAAPDSALGPIVLETTPEGYTASVVVRPPGQPSLRWVVRHDSRLTGTPIEPGPRATP